MVDDYIKSVKAYLYDRISSPLLGAFTLSWLIWNYKFTMVVFSGRDLAEKFEFIDNVLYPSILVHSAYWVLFPLLTTFFFVFIYPYPARWVYRFWRARQKELKQIRQKIDGDDLLTVEESRVLKVAVFELEMKYDSMMQKKEEEKSVLEEQIVDRDTKISIYKSTIEDLKGEDSSSKRRVNDTHDDRMALLKCVSEHNGGVTVKSLKDLLGWSDVRLEFHIQDALKSDQLYLGDDKSTGKILLHHEGKRLLVNAGLV